MLWEYIKLNYLEGESLCIMISHQIYTVHVLHVLYMEKHFLNPLLPLMLKKMSNVKGQLSILLLILETWNAVTLSQF